MLTGSSVINYLMFIITHKMTCRVRQCIVEAKCMLERAFLVLKHMLKVYGIILYYVFYVLLCTIDYIMLSK